MALSSESYYLQIRKQVERVRGFAFVEMTDEAHEESAISQLDGAEWMGRQLRVNKARPRDNNRGGSRRHTANNAW